MKIKLLLTTAAFLFVFCQNETESQEFQIQLSNFSLNDSVRLDLHTESIPLEVHLYAAPSAQSGTAVDVYDTIPAAHYGWRVYVSSAPFDSGFISIQNDKRVVYDDRSGPPESWLNWYDD